MDWLHKWALTSKNIALKCLDTGKTFTYPELDFAASQAAFYMSREMNICQSDRVCFLATNCWEHIVCFFACQRLGAIFVPLNFRLTERELLDVIGDANPKVLFVDEQFEELQKSLTCLCVRTKTIDSFVGGLYTLETSQELYEQVVNSKIQSTDASLMLYTSGTTGVAKGVLLSEQGMFWNALNTALRLGLTFETKHLCFHPFFHASGWNVLTLPTLRFGGTVFLNSKFEPSDILKHIGELGITILFGVPTMLDRMAHNDNFSSCRLSSLRFAIVGGEPMPLEAIKLWHARGVPIRQGFGLTEFGPNVFSLNAEDAERKLGSIGTPNFYLDARVVGHDGQICTHNEVGELQLKGPVQMLGYWNKPEETQNAFDGEWLKTGDLVSFDTEGYFFVRGRKKEMYISGGENVFPAEVEKVLRECPGVREAAVIGVPDAKWGEVGYAFVVGHPGNNMQSDDILNHARKLLAKYKIPKHIRIIDELPKSDSGKILKRALPAMAVKT